METNIYENARNKYKPENIKILFVGESVPNSGKFFYLNDTYLYQYTKKAFERLNNTQNFTRENFKELGCWLYDVCDAPVNKTSSAEKRKQIKAGIPKLEKNIKELNPNYIIVVKKSDMRKLVYEPLLKKDYINIKTTFNLPFPNCGHQNEYANELYEILKQIYK